MSPALALQAPRANRPWAALALGALWFLGGCASVAPQDADGRLALAERVWRLIDERHIDPGPPDWAQALVRHRQAVLDAPAEDPEALWLALDQMAGERRDAHTRVEGPREVLRKTEYRGPSLGLGLGQVEGQWVVDRVQPDSPAAEAGLRAGDALLAWNGRAPEALWAERMAQARHSSTPQARELTALRLWLDGPAGSTVALRWQDASGQVREQTLTRRELTLPTRWRFELRPSGVGVLRWNRFDERIEAELRAALRSLPPLKGLVLDLRGNGGGSFAMTLSLLDLLLPEPTAVQHSARRNSPTPEVHRVGGSQALYAGPLRVLLDRGSASGSEMLASSLQFAGRARVLGETSCGCLLAIRRTVELGGQARLLISEQSLVLPDGRRIEGQGVQPDRVVARSLAGLRAGQDEVLEAAEAELLGR